MMKNKLYKIFDAVTMVLSPLVENLFDHAELLSARRVVRRGKRYVLIASDATALRDARATGTPCRESFGW